MNTSYNPDFGPAAQTPEQRAGVVKRMQQAIPSLKKQVNAQASALYAHYVAGEMSWQEIRQAMEANACQ